MKLFFSAFFTALLLGFWMPWWSIAIAGFISALITGTAPGRDFLAGFLAIGLLWFVHALWIDIQNEGLLSGRVAEAFQLPSGFMLILLTALAGGIVGGISTLAGGMTAGLFKKKPRE